MNYENLLPNELETLIYRGDDAAAIYAGKNLSKIIKDRVEDEVNEHLNSAEEEAYERGKKELAQEILEEWESQLSDKGFDELAAKLECIA